ncbi:hypothetical protein ACFW34_35095 [Streptomyces sp. NPDC058848]|uniref:hypothetical protein n=1 Tax=Streptomyces sp. NPDC058848 TaxID=3346650 RepID=UPI0036799934
MRPFHIVLVLSTAAAAVTAYGARRAATAGAHVPPEAVALHGAAQFYRSLAEYFGRQALRAEASYWKVVGHG